MHHWRRQHLIRRTLQANNHDLNTPQETHTQRVQQDLKNAGLSLYGRNSHEASYLPHIIHKDEPIEAAVFGYHEVGFVLLVATNWRIIFLDRKPLFINEDEVHYRFVSGIAYNHTPLGTSIALHTRVKEFKLLGLNKDSALKFVHFIEEKIMEHSNGGKVAS